MITFGRAFAVAGAVAALSLAVPTWTQAAEVSGKELSSMLPGKTILGSTDRCKAITYVLGTMASGAEKGDITIDCDGKKDDGKWWVAGDKFCFQLKTMAGGNQFCFDVKKEGGGEWAFYRADGSKTKMQLKK